MLFTTVLIVLSIAPLSSLWADDYQHTERRKINFFANLSIANATISTTESSQTLTSSTKVSLIGAELGGDYFFSRQWAVSGQLLFPLMANISAEVRGYKIGTRYYHWNEGHELEANLFGSSLKSVSGMAPYFYLAYTNREFQFSSVNLVFQGFEFGGGLDFRYNQDYFFRVGGGLQMLKNTTLRNLNGLVIDFAIGKSF